MQQDDTSIDKLHIQCIHNPHTAWDSISIFTWETLVGLAYGYATILSGSIIVPITSHALNNLIGGILWRYFPTKLEEK